MFNKSVLTIALLALPAFAGAIELTDFKDPNTGFDEAYLDFNANANSGNQDQTSFSSFLDVNYLKRESTERRVWGIDANGTSTASRGPNAGDDTVDDFGFSIGANTDVYFSSTNEQLFYFGAGSFAHQDSAIDDNIGVTAGVGYGRVWNATPLAKALRIQEELNQHGLLAQDLSDEDLLALAEVIGSEDEYRSEHGVDEYRGPWYSDMEQVFSAADALPTGKLTALATVKLDDVLFDEPISARRHGWLVRGGAGFQSSDFSGIADNDPKLTFQAEYARPVGLRGQWIDTATYEPIFGDNTVQTFNNRLSYSYEISDRIDWINSWDLSVQVADDNNDSRFTTNTLTTAFNYHLTNMLDLGLTIAAIDSDEKPNTNPANDEVNTSAILGVRYRLK